MIIETQTRDPKGFQRPMSSRLTLLLRSPPFQNETIARLMFAPGFKSFCQLAPWADWMMAAAASFGFALAAAHRVIDRIHHHSTNMWSAPLPASAPCFA